MLTQTWHLCHINHTSNIQMLTWPCIKPLNSIYNAFVYKTIILSLMRADTKPEKFHQPFEFAVAAHQIPGDYCNIGYPPETHIKLKSTEISFFHNSSHSCYLRLLKFCTEFAILLLPSPVHNFKTIWGGWEWGWDVMVGFLYHNSP